MKPGIWDSGHLWDHFPSVPATGASGSPLCPPPDQLAPGLLLQNLWSPFAGEVGAEYVPTVLAVNISLGFCFQPFKSSLWTCPTRDPDTSRKTGHDLAHGVSGAHIGSRDKIRIKEITFTHKRHLDCCSRSRCRLRES